MNEPLITQKEIDDVIYSVLIKLLRKPIVKPPGVDKTYMTGLQWKAMRDILPQNPQLRATRPKYEEEGTYWYCADDGMHLHMYGKDSNSGFQVLYNSDDNDAGDWIVYEP